MATDNVVNMVSSIGNADNLEIFEMLMKGEICGCKIGERFDLDNKGVISKMSPMVESGLVDVVAGLEWNKYKINETQMCILNKYFNDQITACRSTGCRCKCGDGCC
ncbi:MAG: hypothetical protein IJT54_07490 [Candidatus Methanomethylophilaceae archaeon]|nr:hypothetical protein [Candidatus Methanomethylophilaceae archaeon]